MGNLSVAVLCARDDSIYKSLPGCDVYDKARDANTYAGNLPIVAHPPCRGWGRLRKQAKPVAGELDLARFTIREIRKWGGVLEHPECSSLWNDQSLPPHGLDDKGDIVFDRHGGFTLVVDQFWWGHLARKRTWLYICGVLPGDIPILPLTLGDAPRVISHSRPIHRPFRSELTKADRERTPRDFALWLLDCAGRSVSKLAT
ncbi:MAG: hypothetical protein COB04_18450 [Gammaproteobacteria bacterium]|nr:MAG: hypothetical protein COB04_18450 [Gammaproteobacteria bacterium]